MFIFVTFDVSPFACFAWFLARAVLNIYFGCSKDQQHMFWLINKRIVHFCQDAWFYEIMMLILIEQN